MYLLCNYFFLSLIKLFIMLCCMFFSFSSSSFLLSSDNTCKGKKPSVLVQKAFIYAI
nr:MAG TPA: hypothetical protein [Caudoviricetes sp.]